MVSRNMCENMIYFMYEKNNTLCVLVCVKYVYIYATIVNNNKNDILL